MPKIKKQRSATSVKSNPLADQILEEQGRAGLRKTPRQKQGQRNGENDDDELEAVPSQVTDRVLKLAAKQKHSSDLRFGEDNELQVEKGQFSAPGSAAGDLADMSDVDLDEEGYVAVPGATEEEERALSLFLPSGPAKTGPSLADIILKKIQIKEARERDAQSDAGSMASGKEGLSPKVIQVYGDIGKWLKTYRAGKIPKAFRVVPSLTNWEEVLALTHPLSWSPAAMYEAVVIFTSNLNPRMAQRFFNLVLLPAVRQNMAEYKKLNFHYFNALKKAIFKPAAFFKGIVLPLAAESCTLREATLISTILAKQALPAMHLAATIVRLCTITPWYGTTSVLLATLLNKKAALPLQVVEHCVAHFCAFAEDDRALPVVWHRSLLVFAQRYKFDLSDEQKKRIKGLLQVHWHEGISTEVRRELLAPKPGDLPAAAAVAKMDVS